MKKTKNIALSIQFNLDGFSFCVSDFLTKKALLFTEYLFDKKQNTPEELLKEIEKIFQSDANLQLEYNAVTVIHQNNLATLVPTLYFDENALANYLKFTIKTLKTDFIAFDDLPEITAKNVYVPYININNYLFQNFGEFDYKHHHTVLIEKLLKIENFKENTMYVNVSKNAIDVFVLKDIKVLLSNSFSYHTKEDFIYYLLFTAEQLQLNPAEFPLYFTGAIHINDDIYKITYKYIKNIFFLESKNALLEELDISKHSNYILLGS
ncbi:MULTISPECIES: DUF3822 family protein [unclassified Polaribacter]|uniref:DUF3822 family protein n=1 Tax=unclassified Polaribacter TaxID=196858 RepID=UPI0021D18239|nr:MULTISPECIES: DUF3822 family protein [unclassified Polaribacter]